MLVTRGPKAFFIQDIRSSACSCVRRSEATEEEREYTGVRTTAVTVLHCSALTGEMRGEQTRLAVLKLLLLVVVHNDVGLD